MLIEKLSGLLEEMKNLIGGDSMLSNMVIWAKCLKYVWIGAKVNGIVWGYKAFKGSLRLLK